ncbi:MAG: 4Fe-4S binding protein [Deltaproteobacteria bacterium]|nr:4Fe-4S binding protein [Deltaproteobacteria bacterium]
MNILERLIRIHNWQKVRYSTIILSCALFFAPFLIIPGLFNSNDFCGTLCIRRFYLYFPGMGLDDLTIQLKVSIAGVFLLLAILIVTFFFGRLWCSFICPVGGFPELVSRSLNNRIKIEYRALPQVAIRYGYFGFYLVMMPMIGISACTLCNFMTIPRIFDAIGGGQMGMNYILSSIGIANVALVALLGFFASKGRAFCAFLCPVGAIDGIVNRIGAAFKFTRHIRVERDRCTGCMACAQACMTGAIEMDDKIALVDQLSCMSCHECVDVCHHGAIEYLSIPPDTRRHRRKRDEVLPPLPEWTALYNPGEGQGLAGIRWQRIIMVSVLAMSLIFIIATWAGAAPRKIDPDGCLSCHAIKGLDYIDKQGILRTATIDESHYYASLHGSVPCKDCHRKIEKYPHKVKNGEVDCAATCHVKEPSKGDKYSHKKVSEEYKGSVHKEGWSKGLTGGNRLKEEKETQSPSCRGCHSNSLYIEEENMARFKELFVNCDRECGRCHQGVAWRGQFGGHIFRRFMGGRWDKENGNKLCNDCHGDIEKMTKAKITDWKSGKKKKSEAPFILATKSYNMTLHAKMVMMKDEMGASCIDCHSPDGFKHNVRQGSDLKASTHKDNLAATCGQDKCHSYATSPLNEGFVRTAMHSLDLPPADKEIAPIDSRRLSSNWFRIAAVLVPLALLTLLLNFGWSTVIKKKGKQWPILGGDSFQIKMLKRTPKGKKKAGSDKGKKLSSLIFLLFLLTPAITKADNLYLDMFDRAQVKQSDADKLKEKLKKHKKVEPVTLTLKPYHKRRSFSNDDPKTLCSSCHGNLPHKKEVKTRTFLNMHSDFITCDGCHFTPKGVEVKKRWIDMESGYMSGISYKETTRSGNKKIASFIKGKPQTLLEDHPFAMETAKNLKTLSIDDKASLILKLHSPLSKKKLGCSTCHSKDQKFLELEDLGYDDAKRKKIEQSSIAKFVERLKKNGPINLKVLGR